MSRLMERVVWGGERDLGDPAVASPGHEVEIAELVVAPDLAVEVVVPVVGIEALVLGPARARRSPEVVVYEEQVGEPVDERRASDPLQRRLFDPQEREVRGLHDRVLLLGRGRCAGSVKWCRSSNSTANCGSLRRHTTKSKWQLSAYQRRPSPNRS